MRRIQNLRALEEQAELTKALRKNEELELAQKKKFLNSSDKLS